MVGTGTGTRIGVGFIGVAAGTLIGDATTIGVGTVTGTRTGTGLGFVGDDTGAIRTGAATGTGTDTGATRTGAATGTGTDTGTRTGTDMGR